ncbi:hypothetical protein HMPREF3098_05600 [Corynebacterium sp. HMSC28B08]|nr:hypothetical protein HMPREF3098_05600 [Corynebacterium sp. HMSC28B08]
MMGYLLFVLILHWIVLSIIEPLVRMTQLMLSSMRKISLESSFLESFTLNLLTPYSTHNPSTLFPIDSTFSKNFLLRWSHELFHARFRLSGFATGF